MVKTRIWLVAGPPPHDQVVCRREKLTWVGNTGAVPEKLTVQIDPQLRVAGETLGMVLSEPADDFILAPRQHDFLLPLGQDLWRLELSARGPVALEAGFVLWSLVQHLLVLNLALDRVLGLGLKLLLASPTNVQVAFDEMLAWPKRLETPFIFGGRDDGLHDVLDRVKTRDCLATPVDELVTLGVVAAQRA